MNRITLFLLLSLIVGPFCASAQNWRANYRLAEKKEAAGDFYLAGYLYESAYRNKPNKKKLAYKSAESYYKTKDFRRAANMYQKIKDNDKLYPFIRLKYARSLKQSGDYDKAIREFVDFINHYKGEDKAEWDEVVNKEIEGCALGITYSDAESGLLKVNHMSPNINSKSMELSPIPITDDLLYFTSLKSGQGRLFRSQKTDGEWDIAEKPENFPTIQDAHFGSGSLSPDMRRFYFTKCQNTNGLRAQCKIYVTIKSSDGWSDPVELAPYINWPNSTTTQPFVTVNNGKEQLFFASDRDGSVGGLDIWMAEREVYSDAFDFTFPKNAGKEINTIGDEQTPYYASDEDALYFSSNAHVSLGGQDVYKSNGSFSRLSPPENLGMPINSPLDDLFFVKSPSGTRGYLVSNRIFGNQKLNTTDEDIFSFHFSPDKLVISGIILDQAHERVNGANISLYAQNGNGELSLLTGKTSYDGSYRFPVFANKNYLIEVEKDGYPVKTYPVETFGAHEQSELVNDFVISTATEPLDLLAAKGKSSEVGASVGSEQSMPNVPLVKPETGTTFKIQLSKSSNNDNINHPKYRRIEDFGQLEKNYIPARDTYWITLGDFSNQKEAIKNLARVKNRGFADAFIVKYINGDRIE